MLAKLVYFLKHPTSLNVAINTLGNYINIFFSLLFVLILTRAFTPVEYGVFNVLFGIAYVLANILDFGTTATIYSYLPPLMADRGENMYRFIKSAFYYQSIFALIVIGILFVSFPYLDKIFFHTGAPLIDLYLTAASVMLFIWQNFVMNILLAAKKFLKANIYLNVSNLVKTVIIFSLMMFGTISIGSVITVFGIIGPLVFFLLLFIQKKDVMFVLLKTKASREDFRFGYTMRYFVASQFYNLGSRMDLFLLSHFNMHTEAGYYGLSQKIILTIIATVVSITQVLSPLFAGATTRKEVRHHFKTGLLYLSLPTVLFLTLIFIPSSIYGIIFTDKYVKAASITGALGLAYLINPFSSVPMLFILYTVKKPGYILLTNILFFFIITIGSYLFIPVYGIIAAPISILIAFLVGAIILVPGSIYEYRKLPDQEPNARR